MKDKIVVLYGPDGRELPKHESRAGFPWFGLFLFCVLAVTLLIEHFHSKEKTSSITTSGAITFTSNSSGFITIEKTSLDVPDLGKPSDAPPSRVVTDKA